MIRHGIASRSYTSRMRGTIGFLRGTTFFFDVFSSPSAALYTCTVTQSLVDDIEHKQLMGTGIGTGIGNTFARDQGHVATYYDNSSGILGTANFLFLMSLMLSLMSLS